MNEVEKLASIIHQARFPYLPPNVVLDQESLDTAEAVIKDGYLPVEEAKLEVLGDEEICHLFEQWEDEYEDVEMTDAKWEIFRSKSLSQATIAHNEKQGKLWRIRE